MKNLIDFFVNYKHWFVFILLEVISLVSLFSYNGYQKSVYFTTANGVVGSVYNAISSVSSYLNLQTINNQMEKENEALRMQVRGLQQKLIDMGIDSLEVEGLSAQYHMVNAQVINSTLHRGANLLTINKGRADGIHEEMGVVSSGGVVGIVYMTSQHYSVILPVISIHSKISCRVQESEYFGTLTWKRISPDIAYATGFPRHAKIKVGEIIETNGFSDIFPPNIPIGEVISVVNSEDGMSYMLKVKLFTDFKNLREVSVITNFHSPERVRLEEKADSLNIDEEPDITKAEEEKAEMKKIEEELKEAEKIKKEEEAKRQAELKALEESENPEGENDNQDSTNDKATKEDAKTE